MSTDGGETFLPKGNGMPFTLVHEMVMDSDENFLFAATDAGPYMYSMMQDEWFYLGGIDAPVQSYTSCEFIPTENIVRFATFGRGIWDFVIADLVGVDEIVSDENMTTFPNPSNGYITIESNAYGRIKVINSMGQVVAETALIEGQNPLNLSFLETGMYLIIGTDIHGHIIKEKIIIK